jgi:hypothetical protein
MGWLPSCRFDVVLHNESMNISRLWVRHLLVVVSLLTGATLGLAQDVDADFVRALTTLYANGVTAGFLRDWCDDRVPALAAQNASALEAWRAKMGMGEIDTQVVALLADRKALIDASLEEKRAGFYAQLDQASQNPAADCQNLEKELNADLDLRVQYANEYKIVAARAAGNAGSGSGSSGSTTGSSSTGSTGSSSTGSSSTGTQPSTTTPSSKLPALPAFDFVKFAKLGLNPEYDPIPDEYRCYARISGDQYAKPQAMLQILTGRKYRFEFAGTVYDGSFVLEGGTSVVFNSGVLVNQDKKYRKYDFDRQTGATINLYELVIAGKEMTFSCAQRGVKDQLVQLRYKRKDPQLGVYACVFADNPEKSVGTLELLPNRRYSDDGKVGSYRVDITGENNGYSNLKFVDGPIKGRGAHYEEDATGELSLSLYDQPSIRCVRKVNPRPNLPVFGPNKAPPGSGKGGLEGRFFLGRTQVSIGGYTPCDGICYDFAFFQKDGYVYTDDAEDTGGLEDINCAKTYPSGFPVCQAYSITGNTIKIGFEEPVPFKRVGKTVEIDGSEYGVLEALDGLKFHGYYSSITGGGSSNAVSTSSYSSSVDLILRKDGRFSRDASSSTFASGSFLGETTFVASSSNSRSNTGTYRVYGNTIEFKYEDGRVVKQFIFAPAGRKDLEYLRIDGRLYWLEKDRQ